MCTSPTLWTVRQPELHTDWLLATGHSHNSFASALPYLEFDGTTARPKLLTSAVHQPQTTVVLLAKFLLLASTGFNKILEGQPWARRLNELQERFSGANTDGQG